MMYVVVKPHRKDIMYHMDFSEANHTNKMAPSWFPWDISEIGIDKDYDGIFEKPIQNSFVAEKFTRQN